MSVKPTRTTVISVATATTLLVAGAAAATIGTSYRHVTIEVDGVSRDVSGFFTTAGDALNTAGVRGTTTSSHPPPTKAFPTATPSSFAPPRPTT